MNFMTKYKLKNKTIQPPTKPPKFKVGDCVHVFYSRKLRAFPAVITKIHYAGEYFYHFFYDGEKCQCTEEYLKKYR